MYTETIKDHFANPRNIGALKNPDAAGMAKNEVDGDKVQIHLKIEQSRITVVKIKVMGCVAAIAAASMYSEMIKNQTIENAQKISREDLSEQLGGLPEHKIHCSLTCIDAFHHAVASLPGQKKI